MFTVVKCCSGLPEVAAEGDGLEEDLGQKDGRAEVDIDAAFEVGHKGAEGEEVALGRRSRSPCRRRRGACG